MEENMSSMVSSGGDDVSTEASDSNSDNYPSSPIKHVDHGGSESVIKFKGIVQQQNGNWGAQIYANNHRVWLGTFKTEKEAAMAYDSAAIQLRSCDSRRNFPWTSITVEEPNFQSLYSQKNVLEMIKDGSYQAKFAEFLRARYRITESSIDSVNLTMMQKRGGCKLLFQKQLTPSDVGKLNRIVIPKKEAVAYFTEVSERVEEDAKAGVMADVNLNFFDRMMRLWKFRYCYWKSSQSFVLTRGWSRFVKDKKLKANDVIAFYLCEFKEAGKMVEKFFMIDPLRGEDSGGVSVSVIEGADDHHSNVGFVKKLEQEMIKTHPPCNVDQKKGFRLFGVQIN